MANNTALFGVPFSATAVGTSSVTATKSLPTGAVTIYITDVSASSDTGTATVQIKDNTTVVWQDICSAGSYNVSFVTPIQTTGTATVVVTAAGAPHTSNFAGYTI